MGLNTESADVRRSSGFRLLIRSIGTADAAVIPVMRQVRPAPDLELAGLLYRAPAELLSGLDQETGTRLRDLLRQTGVEVDLLPASEPFETATEELEVALVLHRFDSVIAVVEETARVLGVTADAAIKIVCTIPAVLLGRVSAATVEALRARFGRLGAELDVSSPATALFDLAVETGDDASRRMVRDVLAEATPTRRWDVGERFLPTGFDAATANHVWEKLSRTAAKVRVLNRAFHRFDVRLESAPATPEFREWLVATTGMPDSMAAVAVARTPFILAESVPGPRMVELLEQAKELGGRASGVMLALQGFALDLLPGGDREAAKPWVEIIAGRVAGEALMRPGGTRMDGPFSKTQARWLQHEMRRAGVTSRLVER